MGRQESPSQQELEFLFDCMARGLQTREIVDEYQGTEYPPRQHRWVAEKQRYYDAARKVLSESIKAEQDPLVAKRREKHFDVLGRLIERLEDVLRNRTSYLVHEFENEGKKGEDWLDGLELAQEGTIFDTGKSDARLHKEVDGERLTEFSLGIEEDPLFECLRSHLEEKTWELFEEWKELLRQLNQQYLYSQTGSEPWNDELVNQMYRRHLQIHDRLLIVLGRARHRGIFPGNCDACP